MSVERSPSHQPSNAPGVTTPARSSGSAVGQGAIQATGRPTGPSAALVERAEPPSSNGLSSTFCMAAFAMFFCMQVYGTLQMFRAEPCPEGAHAHKCYRPFFADGEAVDMAMFLTAEPGLRWWTTEGLAELQRTPLWNMSKVAFGRPLPEEEAVVAAIVPLSAELLWPIRKNESRLFVHLFVARAGTLLNESVSKDEPYKALTNLRVLSSNVLHTSEPITRPLPQLSRPRRNLLSSEGADAAGAGQHMRVELMANWSIPLFPGEMLKWTALFFSVTASLSPHPALAVLRHGSLVLMPCLYRFYQQQQETARLLARREAREDQEWLLGNPAPIVPHMVPQLQISVPSDDGSYARPPLLYKELSFEPGHPMPLEKDVRYPVVTFKDGAGHSFRRYVPPISIDVWRARTKEWRPLDSDPGKEDPVLPVELTFDGMIRFSVIQTIRESVKMYTNMGISESDLEDIWEFLFRHPLHIMALMQVISMAQVTLSTLAFKNDISFFKGRRDYTGLSSRSLATDTVHEIVLFLYLYDFEHISRIILFQMGTSALIGAWKFAKVARLRISWQYFLPWLTYNRGGADKTEQDTEDIDAAGMRMLKYILYPLSFCWGLWNLYHYTYKNWWSWAISSAADFAYTFGFVNMMPQIFINYKLKSVAHMPWRVLIYKFFNTFIDDVFAFFIMSDYMTKKHRLMTLRDDIVFFIFLYQRYIYRVDPTRADEFGFVYADAGGSPVEEPGEIEDSSKASPEQAHEALAGPSSTADEDDDSPDGVFGDVSSTPTMAPAGDDGCRRRSSCGAKAGEEE